ncbi:MAG: hypothetical protein PHG81_00935 [Aliarcobacter sp.]|nr:hypothetical protein [Aliarcobacter sp.]
MIKQLTLFTVTLISIIAVYIFLLGENKTIEIIKNDYFYLLSLIPMGLIYLYFRLKLKDYELIDFNKNTNLSFRTSIVIFLVFEVIDYIQEDGFIGMISQWFFYWVMSIIALVLVENINYLKNYVLIKKAAK